MKRLLFSILMVLVFATSSFGALSATAVWEYNASSNAGNVNGGAFNPANPNMATDLTATSATGDSPVVTSVSYTFISADTNHWVYVQAGANWTPGWYEITSVSAGAATLKAAVGQALQGTAPYLAVNTVAGCATTASPTGGTWTVDYSQQTVNNSPYYLYTTDLTAASTTTATSVTMGFGVNTIANTLHVTAGTSWTATNGWYEILSVAAGVATFSSALTGFPNANLGTGYLGGAISLGSSTVGRTDASVSGVQVAGNTTYLNPVAAFNLAATFSPTIGTATVPSYLVGYVTNRTIIPTGSDRPILSATGSYTTTLGANQIWKNLIITTATNNTNANAMTTSGANNYIKNCKIFHGNVGAAAKVALNVSAIRSVKVVDSEIITTGYDASCYAINVTTTAYPVSLGPGLWIHGTSGAASGTCVNYVTGGIRLFDSIIGPDCGVVGLNTAASNQSGIILGNTFFGPASATPTTQVGTGILSAGTAFDGWIISNNIFYGWTTAINPNVIAYTSKSDWNDYYNNGTDIAGTPPYIVKGTNDLAVDPQFTSAPTDLSVGTNLKAMGVPGVSAFNGLSTTHGYRDIGAVQRVESAASGGGAWGF